MYQVPKYTPKIRLLSREGDVWEYPNINQAADALYRIFRYGIREQIGDQWRKERNRDFRLDTPYYFYYAYILQDEFGEPVTVDELLAARSKTRNFYDRIYSKRNDFEFRNGSVPYIHRRKLFCGCRHMKTTQEIREVETLDLDEDAQYYSVKIRAKRNKANLPEAWDDHWRSYINKNWKHYRKTQWKK